ncbi:DUF4276 family protein [Micromonospora sp. BRA006-A]|uniref:DUF4276 family protein n=1 Tax=Micromonospora sp. BRA006-A TaxID=2962860 RepID=UPI00296EE36E|nr:DUF4276 family protein [Micromonospora sp. BRA006-A]MDW3846465.1 DUF4276 family protein [Micromonospora sp. BRA006-A]
MRYLTSALVSEGVTDDQFLPRLLARALTEICQVEFEDTVEVADVQPLRERRGPCSVADVVSLVEKNPASFSLVFFHHDQGANPERVAAEWLQPLRDLWGDRAEQLIAVVPVRETEAWLLADGDALRSALGVRWSDAEMGLPEQPRRVESIADPKKVLNNIMDRISRSTTDHFGQLGELVSLAKLDGVPAYRQWWSDTRDTLIRLGYRQT